MESTRYRVPELCCAEEERLLLKQIEPLPGVDRISVDIFRQAVDIRHSCPQSDISAAIRKIGFTPLLDHGGVSDEPFLKRYRFHLTTIAGAVMLVAGLALEFGAVQIPALTGDAPAGGPGGWTADALFLAAIVTSGWKIIARAFTAARHLTLDMNFLMTVAAAGAAVIDKTAEAAAVMVLFSIAQLLELQTVAHARRSISALIKKAPSTAFVLNDGGEKETPVGEIGIGETILVRSGEAVAIDGVVAAGKSPVDESMITGEPLPVVKTAGDRVYGGSINGTGILEIRTTARHADSTVSRIVRMVEDAQSRRSAAQQFAERFARIYTPVVIGIAILVAVVPPIFNLAPETPAGEWLYRALVLLVIACPCALVISTPVTIVSALAAAAKRGILIKGGRFLEEIGRVRVFAFDKTGTLTLGKPRVTDLVTLDAASQADLLRTAAAIESGSEHHFASAILERAAADGVVPLAARLESFESFESVPGRGIRAVSGSKRYVLGNHAFIEESGLCSPRLEADLLRLERDGKSVIAVIEEGRPLGVIGIADEIRKESADVVRRLKGSGVEKTLMLSGDNRVTAGAIAAGIGIDEIHADLLPEEKVARVTGLRNSYGGVAMVGDGINDAPALAGSTVGVAMGTSGSDVALETADVVLMGDDLGKIAVARELGKKAVKIIKQNMVIALGTKLVFLILAMTGEASLWSAVLADDGATIVVIFNGLRILRGV